MKIVRPLTRKVFALKRMCEHCRAPQLDGCDPAHILSRGAGQVDFHCNLVALCRKCHASQHAGNKPTVKDMYGIAASRESTTPEAIHDAVQWARNRIKKNEEPASIRAKLAEVEDDGLYSLLYSELTMADLI